MHDPPERKYNAGTCQLAGGVHHSGCRLLTPPSTGKITHKSHNRMSGGRQQPSGRKTGRATLSFQPMLPSISLPGRVEAMIQVYTDCIGYWRISESPSVIENEENAAS